MVLVTVRDLRCHDVLSEFKDLSDNLDIGELKKLFCDSTKKTKYCRCSFRVSPRDKTLGNNIKLSQIGDSTKKHSLTLYFRDLGPQIGWKTVFYMEYTGPIIIYALMWLSRQQWTFNLLDGYPNLQGLLPTRLRTYTVLRELAMYCYVGHFMKRLLETAFVHRFSQATMPLRNLYKNCSYYFAFAAFIAYFTNHHLYTPPMFGQRQVYLGFILFLLGEVGNFSCHLALMRLRPHGSNIRRMPRPMALLPPTQLFRLVVSPNYTYEVISWIGFTIMTQTLPAALFTLVGLCQMSVWARGKLRTYRAEFPQDSRRHKAIIPFVL